MSQTRPILNCNNNINCNICNIFYADNAADAACAAGFAFNSVPDTRDSVPQMPPPSPPPFSIRHHRRIITKESLILKNPANFPNQNKDRAMNVFLFFLGVFVVKMHWIWLLAVDWRLKTYMADLASDIH
jgi:hypothetical protein